MKRLWLKIILVAVVLVFFISTIIAKGPEKDRILAQVLIQGLEAWHYNPQKVDDQFSERVYTLYLNSLDSNKRFFLQSDIDQFKQYQFKIDDQLKRGTEEFYDLTWNIYQKRLEEVSLLIKDLLNKPFNFLVNENFETDPKKLAYPGNLKELKEQWRLYLKYQTLLAYLDLISPQKSSADVKEEGEKSTVNLDQPFKPELEKQAREKVAKNLKRNIERLLQKGNDKRLDGYLNAIARSFDPHTEYFPPQDKEEFDISMSGTLEGIGALLAEDGDYTKVAETFPGSPAWRQKSLQTEDLILKVAQGDGEPVDVAGMPVTDVVQLIRGKKGTEVRLTVKKPNGQIVVIPIIRDVVVIEETYAKSAIIFNEKTDKKYGYINLPSFYHDFKTNSRKSADDVRQELIKLKAEKVNGVILDLRNNGGGSLEDAVEMAGLFIKDGPVVQVKDSENRKAKLTDPDPDIVYNDPLVILVNSLSASASEILAAALQDYGRAVIVGGPSTFGKGTVQVFVDLDQYIPNSMASYKPTGSLKFTFKKFYRITGYSTQGKGVTADIPLPDLYSYLGVGEKKLKYSLAWDTITATPYKRWTSGNINIANLKQLSAGRIKSNKAFKLITDNIARIKSQRDNSAEPLNFSQFLAEQKQLRQEADNMRNILEEELSYIKVTSPKVDKVDPSSPNYKKNKDWYKQISKDIYIDEAWHILDNMTVGK